MHKIENGKVVRPYTKQDIIDMAQGRGTHINTDGIQYDLDGTGMANYLTGLGFTVTDNHDTGSYGKITTAEGVIASTNGFVRMAPNQL